MIRQSTGIAQYFAMKVRKAESFSALPPPFMTFGVSVGAMLSAELPVSVGDGAAVTVGVGVSAPVGIAGTVDGTASGVIVGDGVSFGIGSVFVCDGSLTQ